MLLSDLDRITKAQGVFIASLEKKYGREAVRLQRRLLEAIQEDLLSRLDVTDGKIVNSPKNYRIIYEFDQVWSDYSDTYFSPTIQRFATDALKVTNFSKDYFKAFGGSISLSTKALTQATENIWLMMGLEQAGKQMKFITGGYLDRLLLASEVRNQVMEYLTDSVTVSTDFKDMLSTLREMIQGKETDGTLQRYFRSYVYDTFSGVQRAYDNYVAEQAGLNYFVYAGTVIESTREFCEDNLNQVFHRDILDEWETQDWKGKNKDLPVKIALGGYNCRHRLNWIPDELVSDFELKT